MSGRCSAGAPIGNTVIKLKLTNNANQVKCWSLRRGNRSYPDEISRCRVENQQTQPTYDARVWESNPGHIGGRRVLRHPCTPPVPCLFNLCELPEIKFVLLCLLGITRLLAAIISSMKFR